MPSCPVYIGNTQNHSGYVSSDQPTDQTVTLTTKDSTAHGNWSTAYSSARQEAPLFSTAPIHAVNPCRFIRSGSGSPTSRPSSPRARARSTAPNPRQPASPAASTGTPRNVTSRPAPSDTMVIA